MNYPTTDLTVFVRQQLGMAPLGCSNFWFLTKPPSGRGPQLGSHSKLDEEGSALELTHVAVGWPQDLPGYCLRLQFLLHGSLHRASHTRAVCFLRGWEEMGERYRNQFSLLRKGLGNGMNIRRWERRLEAILNNSKYKY